MSIWFDIHKRSNGLQERKEDIIKDEDNSWVFYDPDIIKKMTEDLKKEQVKLSTSISDLRRELDKFTWYNKKYNKCKYDL